MQVALSAGVSHALGAHRVVGCVAWDLHAGHDGGEHNAHMPLAHFREGDGDGVVHL